MKNKRSTKPKPATAKRQDSLKMSSLATAISRVERLVNNKQREAQLTPLGRLARDAGNTVSGFFGGGKIFGSGAYKMQANSSWNTGNQVPTFASTTDKVTFAHREYVCDVNSNVGFTINNTFNVNPGLSSTFPYLSTIAQNFQEYKFKGLVFEFKSTSADALNSTNTALGQIMMLAQYRSDAPVPSNKPQFLNEMWSTDTKPSCNDFLPVECAPVENPLSVQYIRSGGLNSNQDQKFYDLCSVSIASSGSQASAVVGELWVTYEVELYKPVVSTSTSDNAGNAAHYSFLNNSGSNLGTLAGHTDNIGITYNVNAGSITLPPNQIGSVYQLTFIYRSGTGVITHNSDGIQNANYLNSYGSYTAGSFTTGSGTANMTLVVTFTCNSNSSASYSPGIASSGSGQALDVYVFGLPTTFV